LPGKNIHFNLLNIGIVRKKNLKNTTENI